MNKVTLLGNLTRDPEVRQTKSGKAVVNACIAVTERFKTEAGESKESVTFVDLVIWGKTTLLNRILVGRPEVPTAVVVNEFGKAGVDGKLVVEEWEKDGQKRRTTKVQVAAWHFVGAKTEAKPAAPKPAASPEAPATETAEDDVPF